MAVTLSDPALVAAEVVERMATSQPDVVALGELVSTAAHIEPEVLRQMRLELASTLHAGVEADLWFSPLVESRSPRGFVLRADVAPVLRARLASDPDRLALVTDLLAALHRGAPASLQLEERLTAVALQPVVDDAAVEAIVREAIKAMVAEPDRGKDVARWAARALPRLPVLARSSDSAWTLAIAAAARLDGRAILPGTPPAAAVAAARALLPDVAPRVGVGARLVPGAVELTYPPDPRATELDAPQSDPVLLAVATAEGSGEQVALRWGTPTQVAQGSPDRPSDVGGSIRLTTADGAAYELTAASADLTLLLVDVPPDDRSTASGTDRPPRTIVASLRGRAGELDQVHRQAEWQDLGSVGVSRLMELGSQIARLLPDAFWAALREAFAASRDRSPSVLIVTDEVRIPWEYAVVPNGTPSNLPPFLGMHVDLGIWMAGVGRATTPEPIALDIARIGVLAAGAGAAPSKVGPLPFAADEARDLQQSFGAVLITPTRTGVTGWLSGRYAADLLHLAGHGDRDGFGLLLQDDTLLDAQLLAGDGRLGSAVVVLNAPGSASEAIPALATAGASAVIAPRDLVPDEAAAEFARDFYGRVLREAAAPAATLRVMRAEAFQRSSGEGGFLSHAYFGHPATTLTRRPAVTVWNLGAGAVEQTLIGHDEFIRAVAWAPDGATIATGAADHTARLWSTSTGRQLQMLRHDAEVRVVAFAPDGSRLATGTDGGAVTIWTPGSPAGSTLIAAGPPVLALAWSPDGAQVAAVVADGSLLLVNSRTGASRGGVTDLALAGPIGWSADRIRAVSPDGVFVIDPSGSSGPQSASMDRVAAGITALDVSPDGVGAALATQDGSIVVWQRAEESQFATGNSIAAIQLRPGMLRAIGTTGALHTWLLPAGQDVKSQDDVPLNGPAAFSPDSHRLASWSQPPAGGPARPDPRVQSAA